ncbi:MAG: NlpC/P60 family protein [Alphaproteobacteria bacterium]
MRSVSSGLDPRLHAFRPDLADENLVGQVAAVRYVRGTMARVAQSRLPVFGASDLSGPMVTELRLGEFVDVFDRGRSIAWVQNRSDHYVGYVAADGLVNTIADPAWRVANLTTNLYMEPGAKATPVDLLPFPARVAVTEFTPDGWARLNAGGFVWTAHLESATVLHPDFVFTAGRLLNVPYLWGGRTALGVDCSGLVQLALELAGLDCPRDSDMQCAAFGVAPPSDWRNYPFARGDLVFFPGHVGMMVDATHVVNANSFHMRVVSEPLVELAARYAYMTAIAPRENFAPRRG